MPSPPPEPHHSVVVPVYGNRDTLPALLQRLERLAGELPGPLEVVLVVDGSPDDSAQVLAQHAPRAQIPVRVLSHSRNFGSFAAIRTGLAAARGDLIGVMAADLQEPPELMVDFFAALRGGAEVAVGRRTGRADPASSSLLSRVYWSAYRRFVMPSIPPGGVDVFAVTRDVAQTLTGFTEAHSSLVGQLFWIGYRRVEIGYQRQPRPSGRSGWTTRKKVTYLLDSVFAFTDLPIRLLTGIGVLGVMATTAVSVLVLVAWALGRIEVPGYTPLMLVILFCTFTMLLGLGIVGSYVWRIFENSKARPLSIVSEETSYGEPWQ
ncbi:MAG: glycosyltransferase family 2 protein [Actinomycetia bacterium]|nr:glycosyltransferase family 2 protein [Actinomycetes bacterium]